MDELRVAVPLVSAAIRPRLDALLSDYAETFRVVNPYHVFATMKTERIELELLGSHDGQDWQPYVFRYKPGDPGRRPPLVMPHQPRLDWRMWFVTMHPRHLQWFEPFARALLENSPAVTALLEHNPFSDRPPRYIRVMAYRYRYTSRAEREQSGDWWQREALGAFTPLAWLERRN